MDRMAYFSQVVPEDGSTELAGFTFFSPTFRFFGTTEQAREQIGAGALYAEDDGFTFLEAVTPRARASLDGLWPSGPAEERKGDVEAATQLAPDVLHWAAADATLSHKKRVCSVKGTQTDNVDVVAQLAEALRQAALDTIHNREENPPSKNVEHTCPVFLIRVKRLKAGMIQPLVPTTFAC